MKQVASILLLGILLINFGGYRIFTDYLERKADLQLQAELDRDQYNEADLIRIKVYASLPYGASSEKFERMDGSIEINGINYTYVKRRFYQDSLELLCIPNTVKTGIKNARDEFFRLANDFVTHSASKKAPVHHTHLAKFSVVDFTGDHSFGWQSGMEDTAVTQYRDLVADLRSAYLSRLEKPPQA